MRNLVNPSNNFRGSKILRQHPHYAEEISNVSTLAKLVKTDEKYEHAIQPQLHDSMRKTHLRVSCVSWLKV